MSNDWLSSLRAYRLVRDAAARPPISPVMSAVSFSTKPSEMRISVFGASMARSPMKRSRSACTV